MTTKSEILHEVRDAMIAAERKHSDQMDVPLGCNLNFAPAAERAKESTDTAFRNGTGTWMHIAFEEAMECFAEEDLDKIRAEALQAAAMFAQIARVCDHQREKADPLTPGHRVRSNDYGWGTVDGIDENSKIGPVAFVTFDHWQAGHTKPYDLSWTRRLERSK